MKRIIFVPQFPTPLRYQEWWYDEFPKKFREEGYDVYVLGDRSLKNIQGGPESPGMFSPIDAAIEFETEQIKEYMEMDIRVDDILFVSDISFPGFFSNVLAHKKPKKCFAYCHATSINKYDYFEPARDGKWLTEMGYSRYFDEVFIGSYYHQRKLEWPNTEVVRLPLPPERIIQYTNLIPEKEIEIASASRPTKQKVDMEIEKHFKVTRRDPKDFDNTWQGYYSFLSASKILLVSSHEDTFGYQIVDAVLNNCIPLVPNRCSYPEILPSQYIYCDVDDLRDRIKLVDEGRLKTPALKCLGEMQMFYQNIINRIS